MLENMLENAIDNVLGEYVRGGSSYEDSVKNQLNALEATGIATSLAVSNMNSGLADAINSNTSEIQGLRSDFQSAAVGLYNQGQSIRQDIQTQTNAIQSMAMGVTSAIHESTYEIVASQQMLANTFNHGFNSVNNTINLGLGLLGNKIDVLSEDVSSKLDEIQDILNNPRLTQSRELYREALRSYKRGFYEEALADCLGAIEKNKTDYISWYLLGLIYLYGAGENSNVINLDKAEEAFANAAKYIKPDIPKSNEAKLLASEIFYHLGFSQLAKSNDYLLENKTEFSNTKLLEAASASLQAYNLSKENLIAGYEHAKELHFLGKDDESIKLLEELIRKEKTFALKAINDKNFESIWSDIEQLIEKLKLEACQLIRESLDKFINKISSEVDTGHNSIIEKVQKTTLQNKETIINKAIELKKENIDWFNSKKDRKLAQYKDIEQKDYFSVLDALTKLPSLYENIEGFVRNCIINTNNIVERQVEEQQKLEEEERERQEEERERQKREERWRKEEEIKKQKREEEQLRKEQEELERRNDIKKYRTGFLINCILMFGLQYSHILYEFGIIDMYIRPDWLPYLLSIIPSLYIAFSPLKDYHCAFGDDTVFQTITVFLLGVTAFFSFFVDDNFFGVINIVTAIIYAIVFCREAILELDNVFTWSPFFIIAVNLMYFAAEYEIVWFFWIAFVLLCFSGYFGASFFIVFGLTSSVSITGSYWWDIVDWVDDIFDDLGVLISVLCIISGIVLFKKMFKRRNEF
ncbi:MAG: hypothetical protein J5978_00350 [Spirochaetaceae bacterium]|nr:hypothetical protein [Spirochaetaceae bacterium]